MTQNTLVLLPLLPKFGEHMCVLVFAELGIEPRAPCRLGKHFTSQAPVPAWQRHTLLLTLNRNLNTIQEHTLLKVIYYRSSCLYILLNQLTPHKYENYEPQYIIY